VHAAAGRRRDFEDNAVIFLGGPCLTVVW
jgi:hypothetical protein